MLITCCNSLRFLALTGNEEKFSCSQTGSNEERQRWLEYLFLSIWTNRQIYALQACIDLATSRREKKSDEREREENETEKERVREGEREKGKDKSSAINLLRLRLHCNDTVHSTSSFEWYCLLFLPCACLFLFFSGYLSLSLILSLSVYRHYETTVAYIRFCR